MSSSEISAAESALVRAVSAARRGTIVVVTGAGISLASGIPTFRGTDPDAVWHRDVTELATRRYFQEDPAASWAWYLRRFDTVDGARPNPAHRALVQLERWCLDAGGDPLVVTQNIDTLHEQAGTENLIKVHGSIDRVRCAREGDCARASPHGSLERGSIDLEPLRREATIDGVPRCPDCGGLLRPHVLWFDEYYTEHRDYRIDDVVYAARHMDLALFVGTSLAVGITDMALGAARDARHGAFLIDPGLDSPYPWVRSVREPAEEVLPRLCEAVGA